MTEKKKVLFVGSFKEKAADGSVGGQMFACRTLVNSVLKDQVDFILIDTTAESVPAPSVFKRIPNALRRIAAVMKNLLINKVDTAIIFSSAGLSLKEKGLMIFIIKMFNVKVIFAPRSGLIIDEVSHSVFSKYFLKLVVKNADVILCQGSSWRSFYIQFEPKKPEKFKILFNWIDTEKYHIIFEQRQIREDSENGILKLLYLGWLEPYKGILTFFEAFETLVKMGYKIEADVFGNGRLVSELNKKINNLAIADIFRIRGWANEQVKLNALNEADIFVLPSFTEGMPNALIEAMSVGLPCISSKAGGAPDLIDHQKNGLLFNAGDVNQLCQNIVQLCEDKELRHLMGQKAHEFSNEKCSIKYAVKYFSEIL